MPSQQEHFELLTQSFEKLAEKLSPSLDSDPDVKSALQSVATHMRGLDLRLVNDELASRIIEGSDLALGAMSRRARGGRGVITNRTSQNLTQTQEWMSALVKSIYATHTLNEEPKTFMDCPRDYVLTGLLLQNVLRVCVDNGISFDEMQAALDSTQMSKDRDVKNMYGNVLLFLMAVANEKGINLENQVFYAQALMVGDGPDKLNTILEQTLDA